MNKPLACIPKIRGLSWDDKVAYLAYKASIVQGPSPLVTHSFQDIWYVKTMYLPAGTRLIGRKHIDGHILKLIQGKVVLLFEVGQKYYEAPDRIHSRPGDRMVAIAQTDIIVEAWILNPDGETDIDVIEASVVEPADEILSRGKLIAAQVDNQLYAESILLSKD